MPKQTFKIEGFHGGLNSNSDPRDVRDIESPNLRDVAIDSVGKIKTLGKFNTGTNNSNTLQILPNRGLFVMSSDRQLDAGAANETLIFLYDNGSHTIDVKDSEGWDTALIDMDDTSIPVYYTADGVVRVSDAGLNENSKWFGYISDRKFYDASSALNADSGAIGWYSIEQSLATPTSGHCLISTPAVGTDSNGIFSPASEYIGDVINDGGTDDVVDHTAVNIRVGVQFNEIIASGHADWDASIDNYNNPSGDSSDVYPCIGTTVTKLEGASSSQTYGAIGVDGLSYTVGENECLIASIYIKSTEYNKLSRFVIAAGGVQWNFGVDKISPDTWNLLVCASDNISLGSENFPIDSATSSFLFTLYDNQSGTNDKPDYYVSGVAIADAQSIEGFQPGVYTFHHTYLYDVEHKQESLPFKFIDVKSADVNAVNVVGSSVLFNFETYICSNNASPAYAFNKRISGSRLYYKKEENDNYFLIGELDFVDKGFKFLPEADTLSYTMINTTDTTAPILSKTALIKGIAPENANTIDTFKTINGFSTEVKSLDAKYKTAVVHGRRVYIGNTRQDGKKYPDRIVKSQVNRFDTFPEGMGSVDVVIRDGENIVKLEAYADRILQFKQHSLYIINVSESVDFLEDTYRNKGCAFDYHVTRTDMGIVWFNDHGCYLYNGKSVLDLLEKQGIRLINEDDWSLFVKDGTDDPDMSSAMIGYVPKKKHLIIKNENNDIYLYDFVIQAWTTGIGKITESTAMTNFALDGDQNLFYVDNTTTVRKTWQTSVQTSTGFEYITPDIDFGQPGVRKKVYKVYVTYKSGATTNVQVDYGVNGGTTFPYDFANGDNFTSNELASASGWQVAELKPDNATESNNIKSFQLRFATDGTVPSGFEINDITIVYRLKNIK